MGPIWDLFKVALGLAVEVSRDMVKAYLEFLKKLGKWSIIVAIILLPLPILGSLIPMSWMSGLYLALIGLIITLWLVAAFPVVMLMGYAYEEIKAIKKTAQLIGGLLFWILLLSIYFYLIPIWSYPAAIPLVFIICAILALGLMRFGIGISPRLAIGAVLIVFCLITISFYMPTTRSAASSFVGWLDNQLAGLITSPLHPSPQVPKRTNYDYVGVEKIVFFDPLTAEPRVWYYKGEDGRIELFDGPGYHPQYKVKLEPITPDIVAQIKSQLKADVERIAQEEQRKKEEAERMARSPQAPNKLRPSLIEGIVFFDPLTAEPRVWYYKGEDGRIELFDGPGYHPQYKAQLEPIAPDVVAQIKSQLKADAERMAEEAKKEQAQKIAKEKGEKPIIVIQPEETTGEVNEPKKSELIKRKEKPIEPEDK